MINNKENNKNQYNQENVKIQLYNNANQKIKEDLKNICSYNKCRKKLKLTSIICKCKLQFCDIHRLPESHCCLYDYKNDSNKNKIIENMKCISKKIDKI